MAEEFAEYARYFHYGLRVEIGIRMPNRDMFREWAVVQEYHDDLIEVELSRDQLPAGVKFEVGTILDVGVWIKEQVYTCNAIVVEKKGTVALIIRLLSAVILKERREFFRLGANLRMRYSVPEGATHGEIRTEWHKRMELEHLKFLEGVSNYLQSPFIVSRWAHLKPEGPQLAWVESPSMPVTISGSGIRFLVPNRLKVDQQINLELHLPLMPSRIAHAVAEVVHVMEPVRPTSNPELFYPTGMRLLYLDERDRDLIIRYVSTEQLEQLRKISNSLRYKWEDEASGEVRAVPPRQRYLKWAMWGILAAVSVLLLGKLYRYYQSQMERNEIESTYGNELGKYRDKRNIKTLP